jgi:DNA repair protein RecO (recombination protein O)
VPTRAVFTDAVLLRSVDYGESDRIVTLLTREFGKVALIARGARRSKKRFAASLEPFLLVSAEVALGRGEVGRLSQAQITRAFPKILSDLERMSLAGAALELVRGTAPVRAADARVFSATVGMLEAFDQAEVARNEMLLAFALRLIATLGFAPRLDMCGRCGKRAPVEKPAYFDPGMGAVVCRDCGGGRLKLSADARARMTACFSGTWAEAAHDAWPKAVFTEARKATVGVLSEHLGREVDLLSTYQ